MMQHKGASGSSYKSSCTYCLHKQGVIFGEIYGLITAFHLLVTQLGGQSIASTWQVLRRKKGCSAVESSRKT